MVNNLSFNRLSHDVVFYLRFHLTHGEQTFQAAVDATTCAVWVSSGFVAASFDQREPFFFFFF